jgi:hypothetical protein
MNDADGRGETELNRAPADGERVLRMVNTAAHHRIDVYVKIRVLGEQLQLLVENFQTLFRNFIGIHVVDGNLQPLESSAVQAPDSFRNQQIAVGDEAGDHTVGANAVDHVVEFGMQQRFAARNCDDGRAQRAQFVDAAEHFVRGHWLREIVELVAVGAGQIAAADRNDVRKDRMVGGSQGAGGHGCPAQVAVQGLGTAAQRYER